MAGLSLVKPSGNAAGGDVLAEPLTDDGRTFYDHFAADTVSGDGQAAGRPELADPDFQNNYRGRPIRLTDLAELFARQSDEMRAAFKAQNWRVLSGTPLSTATHAVTDWQNAYRSWRLDPERPEPSIEDSLDIVTMRMDGYDAAEAPIPDHVREQVAAEQQARERLASSSVTTMADGLSWLRQDLETGGDPVVLDFNCFWGTGSGGDMTVPFTLQTGEVMMLFGDTKLGKSAMCANILYHAANGTGGHTPRRCLDCSLEMPLRDLVERYLQIGHGLRQGSDPLGRDYREVNDAILTWERPTLLKPVERISMLTVADAPLAFSRLEEAITSSRAEVVVIDTLESILPPPPPPGHRSYSEPGAAHATLEALMSLANRLRVAVIVVVHINKSGQRAASKGEMPELGDVKGLSKAAQACSFVVAYGGDRNGYLRALQLRGWRRTQNLGPGDRLSFTGDPLTLRFRPNPPETA